MLFQSRLAEFERRVAEAEAERIERRHIVEQVAAAGRRLVVVVRRHVADGARNRDRQLAAGVDIAEQRFGDGAARSPVPGTSTRRSTGTFSARLRIASGRPLNRSAMIGLARGGERVDQLVLLTDQVETRAVAQVVAHPGFAGCLLVAADGQDDRIGAAGDFDGLGDAAAVLGGVARHDFVLPPRAADRDLAAFVVQDFDAVADALANAGEDGRGRFGRPL